MFKILYAVKFTLPVTVSMLEIYFSIVLISNRYFCVIAIFVAGTLERALVTPSVILTELERKMLLCYPSNSYELIEIYPYG